MLRLALLFIIWSMTELYLLVQIGRATSAMTAIALVIVTGFVGAALAKREGIKTYSRIRSDLAAGRVPADQLIDALLILVAGLLLITPGLISDTVGIILLLPPARHRVREYLKKRFRSKFTFMHLGSPFQQRRTDEDIIDVEVREISRKPLPKQEDK